MSYLDKYEEVDFARHCPKCKYDECESWQDPCFDCMDEVVRKYSDVPVNFTPVEIHKKG